MSLRVIVVLGAFAGTLYILSSVLGGSQGLSLNERGRLQLPLQADYVNVDAEGRPIGGGGSLQGFCEADAIVLLRDGEVEKTREMGANPVQVGEQVLRIGNNDSYSPVYRGEDGKLREGCAPESWQSYREAPLEP